MLRYLSTLSVLAAFSVAGFGQTLVIDQSMTVDTKGGGDAASDIIGGDDGRDPGLEFEVNTDIVGTTISEAPTAPSVVIDLSGFRNPDEVPKRLDISVYPVPAFDWAVAQVDMPAGGHGSLRLLDMQGVVHNIQQVAWREAGQYEVMTSLDDLPPGVYLWDIETDSGRAQGRLIKQ